jgi:hypothetical protein
MLQRAARVCTVHGARWARWVVMWSASLDQLQQYEFLCPCVCLTPALPTTAASPELGGHDLSQAAVRRHRCELAIVSKLAGPFRRLHFITTAHRATFKGKTGWSAANKTYRTSPYLDDTQAGVCSNTPCAVCQVHHCSLFSTRTSTSTPF